MATVHTVTGPIDTANLGFTLMHEHIFVLSEGVNANFPQLWDRDDARRAGDRGAARGEGARRVDDRRPDGAGAGARRGARARDRAASPACRSSWRRGSTRTTSCRTTSHRGAAEHMADLLRRSDIEEGIQDTDIRAAILKCATDEKGVTPGVEKVLRAVARAHRRTGVPISTHTHAATRAGSRSAAHLQGRGRRPEARRHRPQRRHRGHRLPRKADGGRLVHRHGPLRHRLVPADGEARGDDRRSCASAAAPTGWCWRTTRRATSTGSTRRW